MKSRQRKPPSMLWQVSASEQLWVPSAHSSTSEGRRGELWEEFRHSWGPLSESPKLEAWASEQLFLTARPQLTVPACATHIPSSPLHAQQAARGPGFKMKSVFCHDC